MDKLLLLISLLFSTGFLYSQEEQEAEKESEGKHIVSVAIAHSSVSQGFVDGKKQWLVLPSWELAYNYRLSERVLIGLHGDFINERYVIEESDTKFIERDFPISIMLVGTYKITERFAFELGGGVEYSSEENLSLIKLGLEYAIPMNKGFETILLIGYDNLINTYDSFNVGLGIAKSF